jgi:hypothetical protein
VRKIDIQQHYRHILSTFSGGILLFGQNKMVKSSPVLSNRDGHAKERN